MMAFTGRQRGLTLVIISSGALAVGRTAVRDLADNLTITQSSSSHITVLRDHVGYLEFFQTTQLKLNFLSPSTGLAVASVLP